jgi:hypothetical protein
MTYRIPVLSLIFAASMLIQAGFTHVQASTPTGVLICHTYSTNIHYGQVDFGSNTEVASLQQTLSTQGYFNVANLGTGRFGPLTLKAVIRFQADHTVPTTGYVGPLTRAALNANQTGCGIGESAAKLYSVSPTSGPTGTVVSIRGFGFSKTNTILLSGNVAAREVPITSSVAIACTTDPSCHGGINQTITFTVPDSIAPYCPPGSMCPMYMRVVTPGEYTISVRNDAGESNTLPFTITGSTI